MKVYFSQGLMLSSNICLKERCLIGTSHLNGAFCFADSGCVPCVVHTLDFSAFRFKNFKGMG